jgi:two-component system CheB/CheR fusion protein
VDVAVEPLQDQHAKVRNYLIEIHSLEAQGAADAPATSEISLELSEAVYADEQVKLLEDELKSTRESLETANEELQVTNEELQSTNEELTTLNAEYERKNQELVVSNTSHENLLESTEDGVLYVDKEMHIRRFNTAVKSAFSLAPSDVGRPLRDIAFNMEGDMTLLDDVKSVLETGERLEREAVLTNGRLYMERITPYLSEGGLVDGALLSFTDVTEASRLQRRFRFALQTAKLSWWDWDLVEEIFHVTSGGSCLLGEGCMNVTRDRDDWMQLVHPDDQEEVRRTLEDCLAGSTAQWDCEHRFRTVSNEWLAM